jgi:hemolysin activation/secretion protein
LLLNLKHQESSMVKMKNTTHRADLKTLQGFASRLLATTAASGLAAVSVAWAQQAPDAGRLLEQTRPLPAPPQPTRPVLPAPARSLALPADNTPIPIERFEFEGNSVLASDQLAALLQDQRGPAVPFGQLRAALSRIDAAYAAQGYFLARAVIPRQDVAVNKGVLRIQVLEGRLEPLRSDLRTDLPADPWQIVQATLQAQGVKTGAPLQQGPLERSLLLIGDRLGAEVPATLAPGSTTGSTEVRIQPTAPAKKWQGQFNLDNAGNRYTGQARALLDLSARDLATLGDALLLRTQLASGLRYAGLSYSLPVGHDGWRIEPSVSQLTYVLCCQFAPLQSEGRTSQWSLNARYPWLLRADRSVYLEAGYLRRHSVDETVAGITKDKVSTPLSLGLSFNHSAAMGGRLLQNGRLQYTSGQLKTRLAAAPSSHYRKLRIDYSAAVQAPPNQQWILRASGQAALTALDSSERFSLGGASGVRGWPSGEASGDSGWLLTAEWRYLLSNQPSGVLQLALFADAGQVSQQKITGAPPSAQATHYGLSSAGLGLAYRHSAGWNVSAQLAHGLGNNPGRSAAGLNSDGRARRTQLWVGMGMGF